MVLMKKPLKILVEVIPSCLMILCHDLKEILPRAGLLKNVFECLSNYFNRSIIGKYQAAEELREKVICLTFF